MGIGTEGAPPLVSVIMPSYNARPYLEKAIASVMAQTMPDWELIVIDDASVDGSFALAKQLQQKDSRIQVLRNEVNSGAARARNRGITLARGRYIAFLDSDDIWCPEKLERQLCALEAAKVRMCYCSYGIIDAFDNPVRADYIVPQRACFEDILKENYIQCSAMLICTEVVKKYMFNTEFFHEDYILGLDILRAGDTAVGCKEILLQWRYLEGSRSFNKRKAARNRWRVYRQYLQLPLFQTVSLFLHYAVAGVQKYSRKP